MADIDIHKVADARRTKQMRVRDLVERVEAFHREAAGMYANARISVEDEEVAALLDHYVEHEQRVAERLKEYRSTAAPEVLETWCKYAPELSLDRLEESVEFDPNQGREEVAEMAGKLSDFLFRVFDTVTEASAAEKVNEAIHDLRDLELREKKYAQRSAEDE